MQATHKQAEVKYRDLRTIAYELTLEQLPYQDREAISLGEITDAASVALNRRQDSRTVDWDWRFGVGSYRKRYPNRFELAIWYNRALCGLSLGRPSFRGTRVRLDFVERVPGENPLAGRVVPVALTAYEIYARLIGASQVRIMDPLRGLVDYYSSFNYVYVEGSGSRHKPAYLYKTLEN
jgi:hypothetical protein